MINRITLKLPGFKCPYLWLHIKKTAGTSLGKQELLNSISEKPIKVNMPHLRQSKGKQIDYSSLISKESERYIQELFGFDFDVYENSK